MKKTLIFSFVVLFCLISSYSKAQSENSTTFKHEIDFEIKDILKKANDQFSRSKEASFEIELPVGIDQQETFLAQYSQIMSKEFFEEYPEIKTYIITKKSDPSISGRCLISPSGVSFYITGKEGTLSLSPTYVDRKHNLQFGSDPEDIQHNHCGVSLKDHLDAVNTSRGPKGRNGDFKRVFRLAIVCTGEFFTGNGGNSTLVNTRIVESVNGIQSIFENDAGVAFELLTPALYTSANADPFTPDQEGGAGRTVQAANAVGMRFNIGDYDVGHAFHKSSAGDGWSGGGVASLGVICNDNPTGTGYYKASGWSGSSNNTTQGWIELATHELGHMFNCPHTFNGIGGSCTDNISGTSGYEIGSGTSIMSYNGICQADNNIPSGGLDGAYFHINSIDRIVGLLEYVGDCPRIEDLGNTAPTANANPCLGIFKIPKNTPFFLEGEGFDADNDNLTYSWEQYNEDGNNTNTQGYIGTTAGNSQVAPLFRSYFPVNTPVRYFPKLENVISGVTDPFEVLPNIARGLKFRFTVRDNNRALGAGVAWDEVNVQVENVGPLTISYPNGNEILNAGENVTFEWETNGTESICDEAIIKLSLDGGNSYPYILAENVDFSTGQSSIQLPDGIPNTQLGRIMIACSDYECMQFFNISRNDFEINSSCNSTSSLLCDISPAVFNQESQELQLGLTAGIGNRIVSYNQLISTDLPTMNAAVRAQDGSCISYDSRNFEFLTISPTVTGEYQFNVDPNNGGGNGYISIFRKNQFNNSCGGFLGSSAQINGATNNISTNNSVIVSLNRCTEYVLAFYNEVVDRTTAISDILGPGQILAQPSSNDNEFGYTFVAVDVNTGLIDLVSENADFINLLPGDYRIYGASFKSSGPTPPADIDPQEWIGLSFSEIYLNSACGIFSTDFKPITINSSCVIGQTLDIGPSTPCDPSTNLHSQTFTVTYDRNPDIGFLVVNGIEFDITGSPQEVTINNLSNGLDTDINIYFSEDPNCVRIFPAHYTAPEECCSFDIDLMENVSACDGEEIIVTPGEGADFYNWYIDGVLQTGVNSSTLSFTESSKVFLEAKSNEGCTIEDSTEVEFFENPYVDLGDEYREVCGGGAFRMTAISDATIYDWYVNDVQVEGIENNIRIRQGGEYKVIVTNLFGCTNVDSVIVDTLLVPQVNLPSNNFICDGDFALLDGGEGGVEFSWFLNNNPLSFDGQFYEATMVGDYTVISTSAEGCVGTDISDVFVYPKPVIQASEDVTFCEGTSTILQVDNMGFVGQLKWFLNGDEIPFATGVQNVAFEPGEYVVQLTTDFGECVGTDTVQVGTYSIPEVSLAPSYTSCNSEIILEVELLPNVEYTWSYNGDVQTTGPGNTYTVTQDNPGVYSVEITTENDCNASAFTSVNFQDNISIDLGADVAECGTGLVSIPSNSSPVTQAIVWELNGNVVQAFGTDFVQNIANLESGTLVASIDAADCPTKDSIELTIFKEPKFNFPPDTVACNGGDFTLSVEFAEGYDITWLRNGMPIAGENSTFLSVNSDGDYKIELSSGLPGCAYEESTSVSFVDGPELTVSTTFIELCEGQSELVTATSADGMIIRWEKDGEQILPNSPTTLEIDSTGIYTVVAGGIGDCDISRDINATFYPIPSFELGEDISACIGESVTLLAGDENWSYQWSQDGNSISENGNSIEITESGNYSVTATSGLDCSFTDDISVDFESTPSVEIVGSNTLCAGTSITLTVQSSQSSFQWQKNGVDIPGEVGLTLIVTEADTYTVIANPGSDCSAEASIEIIESNVPSLDLGNDIEVCSNEDATIIANTEATEIIWFRDGQQIIGETSLTYTPDISGFYEALVSIGPDCTAREGVTVKISTAPTINVVENVNFCPGFSEDVIPNISDGNQYLWTLNGEEIQDQITAAITIDKPGEYKLIVSNDEGCSAEAIINAIQDEGPIVDLGVDRTECTGTAIILDAGNPGASYTWFNNGFAIPFTNGQTFEVSNEGTNTFSVEVDDGSECIGRDEVIITIGDSPGIELDEQAFLCPGTTITLEAISQANSYQWYLEDDPIIGANSTTLEIDATGRYTFEASNGDDCSGTKEILVSEVDPPTFDLGGDMEICEGQILTLDIGPQNGLIQLTKNETEISTIESVFTISEPGTYDVTVRLNENCQTTERIIISEGLPPELNIAPSAVICEGNPITLTAESQATNYLWYIDDILINGEESSTITINQAGTYTIEAFDNEACKNIMFVDVTPIEAPEVDLGPDQNICASEEITLSAGNENLDIQWFKDGDIYETGVSEITINEQGTYTVDISAGGDCNGFDEFILTVSSEPTFNLPDAAAFCEGTSIILDAETDASTIEWYKNGVIIPEATNSPTIEISEADTYEFIAYDNENCPATQTIEISATEAPIVDLGEDKVFCQGEPITLDVGNIGNEYIWFLDNDIYATDVSSIEVTESGNYSVEVSAGGDCQGMDEVNIDIVNVPTITLPEETAFCEGSEITLDAGGDADNYSWSFESDEIPNEINASIIVSQEGTYSVTAFNAENCPVTALVVVNQISMPEVNLGDDISVCETEQIILDAGNQGNVYNWVVNGNPSSNENSTIEATESGTYMVTVSAGNDCSATDEIQVEILRTPEIEVDSDFFYCTGSTVNVSASGNASTFDWSLGGQSVSGAMMNEVEIGEAGILTLTAYDDINCPFIAEINITEVESIPIDLGDDISACSSDPPVINSNIIDATVEWYFENELVFTGLEYTPAASGEYTAIVNPGSECETMDVITIQLSDTPAVTAPENASICLGSESTIALNGTAENIEWTYNGDIILGENSPSLTINAGGEYSAIVSNDPNCPLSLNITVEEIAQPMVDLGEDVSTCDSEPIVLNAGTDGNEYNWSVNGNPISETDNMYTPVESGEYIVEVFVSDNCSAIDIINVEIIQTPVLTQLSSAAICDGESATLDAGGNAANYVWSLGGEIQTDLTTSSVMVTQPGIYTVEAFNDPLCVSSSISTVEVGSIPSLSLGEDLSLCPGENVSFDVGDFPIIVWNDGTLTSDYNVVSPNPTSETTESYSVQVTNDAGCTNEDEILITFSPIIQANVVAESNGVCLGNAVTINASGGQNYNWSNPSNSLNTNNGSTVSAMPFASTTYSVTVSDNCPNNEDVQTVTIDVYDTATSISLDTCIFEGFDYTIFASGGESYIWSPNDESIISGSTQNSITVAPVETTVYTAMITDQFGCEYVESVEICVKENPIDLIDFITILTPNGDGKNDFLEFKGLEAYPDNLLRVYNRWGAQVYKRPRYQSDDVLWDGTRNGVELPPDTYFYILEFEGFQVKKTLTIVKE